MFKKNRIAIVCLALMLLLAGCKNNNPVTDSSNTPEASLNVSNVTVDEEVVVEPTEQTSALAGFDLGVVPEYNGTPYVEINNNKPFFTADEILDVSDFETYPDLDSLGRCQACTACLSIATMPAEGEVRGSIGSVKPSGWHTANYNEYPGLIDGNYLYNRCHLIGWQLGNENANPNNLVTGTRYLNVDGMLPFENRVAEYIRSTQHHVLYRVTPIFEGDELVCRGILLEAQSIEDSGCVFCVYCYNVQPYVFIDYATGDNHIDDSYFSKDETSVLEKEHDGIEHDYVLNTNSMKVHTPDCSSVDTIKDENKQYYTGYLADLEAEGYSPCGNCHPQ